MKRSSPPQIKKFPAAKQRLMDTLLEKNSEGSISASERADLQRLVAEAERLMVANGKRLAKFAEGHPDAPPVGAVPLTIWVSPERTGA